MNPGFSWRRRARLRPSRVELPSENHRDYDSSIRANGEKQRFVIVLAGSVNTTVGTTITATETREVSMRSVAVIFQQGTVGQK